MRTHTDVYSDDDKLIKSFDKYGSIMKEGWIAVYKEPLIEIISECPNFSTCKVFLYILAMQDYTPYVNVTQAHISRKFGMTRTTVSNAITWLEENGYLKRVEENGQRKFLLNPEFASCGRSSIPDRIKLWSQFADEDDHDLNDLSSSRHVRLINPTSAKS